jgi:L-ascorbate metabolism protein UlaG (beta-lactamase superfamily)
MKVRWLGWAGVEIEAAGRTIVIDPLEDAAAVFAWRGDAARAGTLPAVTAPAASAAVAGLVTHLHRDHADAAALCAALGPDAPVFHPRSFGGRDEENLALAQADAEMSAAGLRRRAVDPWETVTAGPFSITALPAVDGTGDPQVSWLADAAGARVLHLGDTVFHGYWWRIAQRHGPFDAVLVPINGAVVDFPHRRPPSPLPAALDPEQAALAGELLGARAVVPIHYDGYAIERVYRPAADAADRFLAAAAGRPYEARVLAVGETLDLGRAVAA